MANTQLNLGINVSTTGDQALDKLSDSLNRVVSISEKAGKSGQKFSSFPSEIKQFVQDPLGSAERSVTSFASSFGVAGLAIGGTVTVLAAVSAAAFAASRDVGRYAEQVSNAAERTGLSTNQVQEFSGAAKIAGVDIGGLTVAMKSLSTGLHDGTEEGKKQKLALAELGIQAEDSLKRIRPAGDLIPEIFRKLGELPPGLDRDFLAKTILGKGGLELIPLIGHLDELTAAVRRTGVVMSNEGITAAAKYDDAFDILGLKLDAAKHKLGLWTAEALMLSTNPFIMALLHGGGKDPEKDAPMPQWVKDIQSGAQGKLDVSTGQANQVIQSFLGKRTAQDLLKEAQAKLAVTPEPVEGKYSTPEAARKAVAEYTSAKDAVKKYEEAVKLAAKEEAAHLAILEQIAKFRRDKTPFYNFGGFGSAEYDPMARRAGTGPSLLKPGEYDPNAPLDDGIRATGLYAGGTFVSSSEDRRTDGFNGIATGGLFDDPKYKQNEQIKLDGLRNELDYTSRIIELRTGPGGELAAALQINSLRLTAAEKEFETTNDIVTLENTRTRLAYERSALAEQDAARGRAKVRDLAGGLFDSLFGGGGGVSKFIENQLQSVARTIVENGAGMGAKALTGMIPKASDPNSTIGKLLQGTPFAADPLKTATDLNTAATVANTTALTAIKTAAMSSSGGGGSAGGSIIGRAGGLFSGQDPNNPYVMHYDGGGSGVFDDSGNEVAGVDKIPGGSSGSGFGMNAKTIAGIGAAVGGGIAAFSDFKTGGAKNDVAGAGALLGAGAGIAAMIPGGQVVALGLGIASAVTSLAAGFLPDPKKAREYQISHDEIERNKYLAPTALNITQDGSGNYTDFDRKGGLRQSPFSAVPNVSQPYLFWRGNTPTEVPGGVTSPFQPTPNITVNIHAIDTVTGVDFLRKNPAAIGEAFADHMQNSEGRAHAAVRYAANA